MAISEDGKAVVSWGICFTPLSPIYKYRLDQNGGICATFVPCRIILIAAERFLAVGCSEITSLVPATKSRFTLTIISCPQSMGMNRLESRQTGDGNFFAYIPGWWCFRPSLLRWGRSHILFHSTVPTPSTLVTSFSPQED